MCKLKVLNSIYTYTRYLIVSRNIEGRLQTLFTQYPVVTITGPRQSGKTTLCRSAFPRLEYANLEAPDQRAFAVDDPKGFLHRFKNGVILDEIQRVPDLASYIQVIVDDRRQNGLFVLTGSQQFSVIEAISQSLTGRTALLRLLPFSIAEVGEHPRTSTVEDLIYTGFYPRIYDQNLDPTQALGDYFETYVERDVRQIAEIRNLSAFRTFVRLCAGRVGQLVNFSSLANDVGVSYTTIKEWMSILEASYIVFLLRPFHANLSKRLVKSPKLYMYDVGLAAFLLGIEHPKQIPTHPLKGALFENLVIMESLKHRYHRGKGNNLFFYRDSTGLEVDMLYQSATDISAVEIKASQTLSSSSFANLEKLKDLIPQQISNLALVYAGRESYQRREVQVTSVTGLGKILEHWDLIRH